MLRGDQREAFIDRTQSIHPLSLHIILLQAKTVFQEPSPLRYRQGDLHRLFKHPTEEAEALHRKHLVHPRQHALRDEGL